MNLVCEKCGIEATKMVAYQLWDVNASFEKLDGYKTFLSSLCDSCAIQQTQGKVILTLDKGTRE